MNDNIMDNDSIRDKLRLRVALLLIKPFGFISLDQDNLVIERDALCNQESYYQSLFTLIEQAFTNKEVPAIVNWYKRKNRPVNLLRQVLSAMNYKLQPERKYQCYIAKKRVYKTQYRIALNNTNQEIPIDL